MTLNASAVHARGTDAQETRASLFPSAAAAAAALIFYLASVPAVCGDGDASEFTLVLGVAGVAHPTGYPLYTLLGHAFCVILHALGVGWPYASNAWSALGAAVAVFFFHATMTRLVRRSTPTGPWVAVALAGAAVLPFALNPVWVGVATVAEVHSWHLAWIWGAAWLFLALLGLAFSDSPAPRSLSGMAVLWGLTCGLGMSHHLTAAFFVLPMSATLGVALIRRGRWSWRLPAAAVVAAFAPLASYGFIYYRAHHPAAYQWPLLQPTLASVMLHIRGSIFDVYVGRFAPSAEQRAVLTATLYPFLFAGLVLLPLLAPRAKATEAKAFLVAMVLAAILQSLFVIHYAVPDPASYFLPALSVALLALPLTSRALMEQSGAGRVLAALIALGLCAVALRWAPQAAAMKRETLRMDARVRERWVRIPAERGVVLWLSDLYCSLLVYQILDREKPGLYVENPNMLTWEGPRQAFANRFGFDALAGLELRDDSEIGRIAPNIARQTALPVFDFNAGRIVEPGAPPGR